MSGDIAVPLPSEANDPKSADVILTLDQKRRIEALKQARNTVQSTAFFAGAKVGDRFSVGDLTYLAEWILGDIEPSETTARDASNAAYFNSGWDAVIREVRAVAAQQGAEAAVEWARTHPAGGRLVADWDAPAVSTSEKPGEWIASEVDTFNNPTQDSFDDHDATADLRSARSDADDGV